MDKFLLQEYASLKATEKATKASIAELGPQIKSMIVEAGADKIDSDLGSFTLVPKPVWTFSPAVEEAEKKVEELKAYEKAKGIATPETRTDLVFKAKLQDDATRDKM